MNRLLFRLSGLEVSIQADDEIPFSLPQEFDPFILDHRSGSSPAATFSVGPAQRAAILETARVSWQSDLARVSNLPDARICIEIFDATSTSWRLAATLSADFSSGTFLRGTVRPDLPFHHPLDRLILLGMLAYRAGGMVHCSCVLDRGRTLIFAGKSGAGKTTMARIWREAGATILNDERNVIRLEEGIPVAGSSPWHGEENQVSPLYAPLAAIFFLRQAPSNSAVECTPEEAAIRLFTSTLVPVFIPQGPGLVLQTWGAVFEKINAYDLSFTPDRGIVDFCRDIIGG